MSEPLLRTPLFDWHRAHDARIVPFGGWEMPVQYTSIVDEHTATRTAAGLFDISHMARILVTGDDAAAKWIDRIVTADVATLREGQIRYALVCNDAGGVLDDVLVYRLPAGSPATFLVVANASNRPKVLDWFESQPRRADSVAFRDATLDFAMLAIQGPRSLAIVQPLLDVACPLGEIPYYTGAPCRCAGRWALVSRTGYTGEDGVEAIVPADLGQSLWQQILDRGAAIGAKPCGLGARDTLRLESAMPLYGHELDEQTNPLEAGLGFAVKLDKADFIGRSALAEIKQTGPRRRRVGLEVEGRRIPREGMSIVHDGQVVGRVTSGTFSPTLKKGIAMGYLPPELSTIGTLVSLDVRGNVEPARIVRLPFYKRMRKE